MGPMAGAKGVVDIAIDARGQFLGKLGIIPLFSRMKPDVLEEKYFILAEVCLHLVDFVPDDVRSE
jgi:hypothetical protein